jgi:REP element-mobilizing transposase RayT
VLVTIRLRAGLPSLRKRRELALIRSRFELAAERFEVRLIEYSVQSNHAHLIVETADERSLARAMNGLFVRIARGLNRLWNRRGAVLDDHYHARALKTPREVRNALVYVLHNARKHGVHFAGPDPCSSGFSFDGWKDLSREAIARMTPPLARARTWLLSIGWRRHGRIEIGERPCGRTSTGR